MTASASTGLDLAWPAEARARALAVELYEWVAGRQLISVHNGLPARFLAEDLPFTDPVSLLVSHDQGVQALLRSNRSGPNSPAIDGWRSGGASRQAFALLWPHLAGVWAKPWIESGRRDRAAAGLPPFREGQDPETVYDSWPPGWPTARSTPAGTGRRAPRPLRHERRPHRRPAGPRGARRGSPPRRPGDPDLQPRSLPRPRSRGWRTDADLLAEVTGVGTEDLKDFSRHWGAPQLLHQPRRPRDRAPQPATCRVARLSPRRSPQLYGLARSGDLFPPRRWPLRATCCGRSVGCRPTTD